MPTRKISKADIHGIIVPMVTAFKGSYGAELDLNAMARLSDYLINNGVHALMPLGTSGEFGLVDREERMQIVESVVKATKSRVPVIAGVSSSGTDNAIQLAKDAASSGADAMISTGPYYYKTNSEGLYLHYTSLLNSVDLPLMVYNIPDWAGYNIPPEVVKKLAVNFKGRVLGVKFTTNDLGLFLDYLRLLKEEVSIMIGSDSLAFSALGLGAAGAVLGSANVLPKETVEIYDKYASGDFEGSRKAQAKVDSLAQTMILGTYPSALKVALRFIGLDCGPVRRPLLPLSPEDSEKVEQSISWKRAN